jgi:hypothetical protein
LREVLIVDSIALCGLMGFCPVEITPQGSCSGAVRYDPTRSGPNQKTRLCKPKRAKEKKLKPESGFVTIYE